ncbi:3-oxoacyl-acp reductase [Fusarium albosuccineum]|uniref:3-oxoacyl-acp reductase n=1 Tax=Fusarium albosuccineum TaxID=1237068 RepID=A0A8H4P6E0_9HYPO|nr:3-oxoacyl-acp reductase [Fusarium albosuccineum]
MPRTTLRFDGRVAIVTGSGRGLGRDYALLLARLGASVVVNSTTAKTAGNTVEEITKDGGKAISHVGSVVDQAVAEALVKAAIDAFGRVDIVINNAGISLPSPFETASSSQLWDTVGVSLGGSWNVTRAAWPHFKEQQYGRVVMITSPIMQGSAQQAAYAAAKLSLVGLTSSLAIEGEPHNILVNSVAPIGLTNATLEQVKDEQMISFMRRYTPTIDVAPTVAWLVHEDSKVNGEAFSAVGRLVTRFFLAETKGFLGSADQNGSIKTIRDNWDQVVDEKDYEVRSDIAKSSPEIFQRLVAGGS